MFPIKNVKIKKEIAQCPQYGAGAVLWVGEGQAGRVGLEKWEASELRGEGLQDQEVPRQRGREERGGGERRAFRGGWRGVQGGSHGASRQRLRWGHTDTRPRSPSPCQAHPWLCTWPAVFLRMCDYF